MQTGFLCFDTTLLFLLKENKFEKNIYTAGPRSGNFQEKDVTMKTRYFGFT